MYVEFVGMVSRAVYASSSLAAAQVTRTPSSASIASRLATRKVTPQLPGCCICLLCLERSRGRACTDLLYFLNSGPTNPRPQTRFLKRFKRSWTIWWCLCIRFGIVHIKQVFIVEMLIMESVRARFCQKYNSSISICLQTLNKTNFFFSLESSPT